MEFGSTMDNPVGYEWAERQMGLGAPPWEHPERYVMNSPSYHFDRVRASLLLLEGTADEFTRAHMDLAFAELKRLGKPVEYRRYPGDGHVPDEWAPANRLDAERRMLQWFDSYVMRAGD
jgi:dipeptidyl aminopeptidase/acylaminoacyl peptidase